MSDFEDDSETPALINSRRLLEIFKSCLYQDPTIKEPPADAMVIKGITMTVCFDPKNLPAVEDEICHYLNQLPDPFYSDKGGGWTFLNMCNDKNEVLWGQHPDMQHLMLLGIAVRRVAYLMPRELWRSLPGGVPYIVVYPQYLSRDMTICSGQLVFTGTHVLASAVQSHIDAGDTSDMILKEFPSLTLQSINALRFTSRSAAA